MNNDEGTYLSMPLFDAKSAICHQLLTAAAATPYAFASVGEAIHKISTTADLNMDFQVSKLLAMTNEFKKRSNFSSSILSIQNLGHHMDIL